MKKRFSIVVLGFLFFAAVVMAGDVTATTDKTSYDMNETVTIKVTNDLGQDIFYSGCGVFSHDTLIFEKKKDNGTWTEIKTPNKWFTCPIDKYVTIKLLPTRYWVRKLASGEETSFQISAKILGVGVYRAAFHYLTNDSSSTVTECKMSAFLCSGSMCNMRCKNITKIEWSWSAVYSNEFSVAELPEVVAPPGEFVRIEKHLRIELKADKRVVYLGDNLTLYGRVTRNGTGDVYDYRISVVAPPQVVVCDSGKKQTSADGNFSYTCKLPTHNESRALNITAISTRLVVPLKAGIAVNDTENNKTVKKSIEILAINRGKYRPWLNAFCNKINITIKHSTTLLQRLEDLREKAAKYNLTRLLNRTDKIQNRLRNMPLLGAYCYDITINDVPQLAVMATELDDNLGDLRNDLTGMIQDINGVQWSKFRRGGA